MNGYIQILKEKLKKRIVVSYALAFLLPFFVLSIYLVVNTNESVKKEGAFNNEKMLAQLSIKMERIFTELDEMALDMSVNMRVDRPRNYVTPFVTSTEEELKRYALLSKMVDNIYIYYYGQERMFSLDGTLSPEVFWKYRYKDEGLVENSFTTALNEKKAMIFYGNVKKMHHLFYFVPFVVRGKVIGRVVYSISIANFQQLIQSEDLSYDGELMFYVRGTPVFSAGNEEKGLLSLQQIEADSSLVSSKTEVIRSLGLSAVSISPKSLLIKKVAPLVLGIILLLLFFMLLGMVLILILSYKQYQPIYRLNKLYEEISSETVHDEVVDEVGDFLFQQKLALEKQTRLSQRIQKSMFWEHLLTGYFEENEEIFSEANRLGIEVNAQTNFLVGIASSDSFEDEVQNLKYKTILTNALPYRNLTYAIEIVEFPQKKIFAFVFSFFSHSATDEMFLNYVKENFTQYVKSLISVDLNLFLGTIEREITRANLSYLTALSRRETLDRVGRLASTENFSLPIEKAETLVQAVRLGNAKLIEKIVGDLQEGERSMFLSGDLYKKYYFYVFSQLLLLVDEVSGKAEIDSTKFVFDEIGEFALLLGQSFAREIKEEKEQNESKLLFIIEANFTNPMFCLDEMALQFDVSLSKMSQMIKSETGISFSKFVQSLRIEKAKQLLIETDCPVKEIVQEVGYLDISNFTRKFRETVGLPPGQYRKLNTRETREVKV